MYMTMEDKILLTCSLPLITDVCLLQLPFTKPLWHGHPVKRRIAVVELIQGSWRALASEKLFAEFKGLCVDIFVVDRVAVRC